MYHAKQNLAKDNLDLLCVELQITLPLKTRKLVYHNMDKLNEKEWVQKNLTGRTWEWQELLRSGRARLDSLEDGELKTMCDTFMTIDSKLEKKLFALGYEAG